MWKERFNQAQKRETQVKVSKSKKMVGDIIYDKYENLTLWGEISEGFKLFFRNYLFLVFIFLICALIVSVISMLSFSDLYWNIQQNIQAFYDEFGSDSTNWPDVAIQSATPLSNTATFTSVGMTVVRFIPLTFGGLIVPYYLVEKIRDKKPSIIAILKKTFSKARLKETIFTILLLTPLFAIGISFLYLPGIILIMLFGFSFFLIPGEIVGPVKIINNGYSYGRDFRMRTFALTTIGVAIFLFVGEMLPEVFLPHYSTTNYFSWLDPQTRNWGQLFLVEFVFIATQTIFQPLVYCFLAVQYVEIGIKKDIDWVHSDEKPNSEKGQKKAIINEKRKTESHKETHNAKIMREKGKLTKFYCPECGSRLNPLKSQTEITCTKCKVKVNLSTKRSG
jgi:DNA-directed RNA polymerase subunit RPC12/RpoP